MMGGGEGGKVKRYQFLRLIRGGVITPQYLPKGRGA